MEIQQPVSIEEVLTICLTVQTKIVLFRKKVKRLIRVMVVMEMKKMLIIMASAKKFKT